MRSVFSLCTCIRSCAVVLFVLLFMHGASAQCPAGYAMCRQARLDFNADCRSLSRFLHCSFVCFSIPSHPSLSHSHSRALSRSLSRALSPGLRSGPNSIGGCSPCRSGFYCASGSFNTMGARDYECAHTSSASVSAGFPLPPFHSKSSLDRLPC
jgi:hypothetical protein